MSNSFMSLRSKLLVSFTVLGVLPLVAVGVFDYVHSQRALEALIGAQVETLAARAARELDERHQRQESDLLLLAENAETQRLYEARRTGDNTGDDPGYTRAYELADTYLRRAWELFGPSYRSIELRDENGVLLYRLGDNGESPLDQSFRVMRPVHSVETGQRIGVLSAESRLDALLPREALEVRFGEAGYSAVIDRTTGRVLYHPRHAFMRQDAASLFSSTAWNVDLTELADSVGRFVYHESDSLRVAAFVSLEEPPWTVVASGAVAEFGAPFARMRLLNLVFVLSITAAVLLGFILVTRKATRSLLRLTTAADEVGRGNLTPSLPATGRDEVGRLTTAFTLMLAKLREMMAQIESSRQMAVIGEFAAQLSHEIRNPLTSLKLNLQSLKRDVRAGLIPAESAPPVEIALKEIERLDRVVRGVLAIGRPGTTRRETCAIHTVLQNALRLVRPQLEHQRIELGTSYLADEDVVVGSDRQLQGAFLNLLLNAIEAMPLGGRLTVQTNTGYSHIDARPELHVRIGDTGLGIPAAQRDQIFRPFFTTKPDGTGFGLPIVLRTIEEHAGRIYLEDGAHQRAGTTFVIVLPLAAAPVPA